MFFFDFGLERFSFHFPWFSTILSFPRFPLDGFASCSSLFVFLSLVFFVFLACSSPPKALGGSRCSVPLPRCCSLIGFVVAVFFSIQVLLYALLLLSGEA